MRVFKNIKERLQGKLPKGARRSSQWSHVRQQHLKANPTCALCGGSRKLEVHHAVPFHVDPTKELDPGNLITLCEAWKRGVNCHLLFGHLGNYRGWNADVHVDVSRWKTRWQMKERG